MRHQVGFLLVELVQLGGVMLLDQAFEECCLADALVAHELNVHIAVRGETASHSVRSQRSAGTATHASRQHGHGLHGSALQQGPVVCLGFLKGLSLLCKLLLHLCQFSLKGSELCILVFNLFVKLRQAFAVYHHLCGVGRQLGSFLRFCLGSLELSLLFAQRLLQSLDALRQGLLLGLQLKLHRLKILIPLPHLGRLLLGLLAFGHQCPNLLGLLLQLLHLRLGRVHPITLLRNQDGSPQGLVDLLLPAPAPGPLNPSCTDEQLVLLGVPPATDRPPPRLNPDHLREHSPVLPLLHRGPARGLDLGSRSLLPAYEEVSASLLAVKKGLNVASEDADCLVHVPADLAAPVRLNQRGTLDQELQASELEALKGSLLEEHHCLTHRPGIPVLRLGHVQLRVQVLQQFLSAKFPIVEVLETRHR
mmetsp:Transcript_61644/g.133480  ORF Transcript_61644/g.133480 Transcript_61644/m.133480 type:complete len:420 (-) Transcript_61644:2281-3540(-)